MFKEFRETVEFQVKFKEMSGQDYAERESSIEEEFNKHVEDIYTTNTQMSDTDNGTPTEEQEDLNSVADSLEKNMTAEMSE